MTIRRIFRLTIGAFVLLFAMWLILFRSGMDSEAPVGMAAAPIFLLTGMGLISVPQLRHRAPVLSAPPTRAAKPTRRNAPRVYATAPMRAPAFVRPKAQPAAKKQPQVIVIARPKPVIVGRAKT